MKRYLICALAVLALSVGTAAPAVATPPGYWYLAAGDVIRLTHNGCTVDFVHGTYGNVAFSRLTLLTPGTCSVESGVQTRAWGDDSSWCPFYLEQQINYPDCDITNVGRTIQTVAVGSLLASGVRIKGIPPGYADLWFTPIP